MFDQRCLAVNQGYWAAYYANAKHPKAPHMILSKILREHHKSKRSKSTKVSKPAVDVDVEAFQAKERKLKALSKK